MFTAIVVSSPWWAPVVEVAVWTAIIWATMD